jgi:acetylornithine deacetylase
MDTVGVKGMTVDPFAARIRDGRMWGRGTCDTKGSMAAFLTALDIAHRRGLAWQDKVYFVATVAEETGCKGAEALVQNGFKVDALVAGEPTMSKLVSAHKGTCWAQLECTGRSAHASLPHAGHNAIYAMAKAIGFVENEYVPSLAARSHPLLGAPTLSVGTISGGVATNIIPDHCTTTLDFRILPDDDPEEVGADFLCRLRQAIPQERFDLSTVQAQRGMETPVDSPWVRNLLGVCAKNTGQASAEGVHYFADSGPFHAAGIACVLFGPGDIIQAHTADEFLKLDQLYLATEIVLDWLELAAKQSLVG